VFTAQGTRRLAASLTALACPEDREAGWCWLAVAATVEGLRCMPRDGSRKRPRLLWASVGPWDRGTVGPAAACIPGGGSGRNRLLESVSAWAARGAHLHARHGSVLDNRHRASSRHMDGDLVRSQSAERTPRARAAQQSVILGITRRPAPGSTRASCAGFSVAGAANRKARIKRACQQLPCRAYRKERVGLSLRPWAVARHGNINYVEVNMYVFMHMANDTHRRL
jgi:hypothetical protein